MDENKPIPAQKPPYLSVHIMLPETVDRRLERWTNKLAGASWPAWGGHVTLVPAFVEKGTPGSARAALQTVCAKEEPFQVRFGAPIAVPDATRPDYFAVFLTIDSTDADAARTEKPRGDGEPIKDEPGKGESGNGEPDRDEPDRDEPGKVEPGKDEPGHGEEVVADADRMPRNDGEAADEYPSHLHRLRQRLLDALLPLREDVYPKLLEQKFLPHVTLALGLGEVEANKLVREIRAEPLTVTFTVEVVWLVTQTFGEGARFDRDPIPLGRVGPVELMRD